ncbi:MAG: penicillin-binding protein 2 [Hyphomicrobiaceae bacterium]|nr:penicillin-binding protein 2 [Hyphomicrobiaceae bacterium]
MGAPTASPVSARLRMLAVAAGVALALLGIAGQLVRLALVQSGETRTASAEPITRTFSRPDIVDRNGHLIATDVVGHSLFADPAMLLDADEAAERLARTLPGLDAAELRRQLADRNRRFLWIRRGLTPLEAQRVHDLGLPGLGFRREPRRVYPGGTLVGHIVGQVSPDNRGVAGIELNIDETLRSEAVQGAMGLVAGAPLRLSLDLGVQHALADELATAARRYRASGAGGVVMEASSGEIVAAYSWPPIDPNVPGAALDRSKPDRVQGGVYELGSILKAMTVAMAIDDGLATLGKTYDIAQPIVFGPHTVRDLHPHPGPMTVRDIFVRSSNVGAASIALEAGTERQLVFLARMGLLEPIRTEVGPVAPPLLPARWGKAETATIAFGHGLAVAPMQLVAAAASLVNGGRRVKPTFIAVGRPNVEGEQVLKPRTSDAMREIMRLNVTLPYGTGRRADVAGYRVGGKTGTAEMPGKGGYQSKAVIASFLGALPMEAPRYVVLVSLYEPQPEDEAKGGITAGLNAAPVTGAVIARIAPILGILPRRLEAGP